MTFQYSTQKMLMVLGIRLAPALFFYYLALIMHEAFYVGAALLLVEALVEIYFMRKRGYAKIEGNRITRIQFFGQKTLEVEDILSTFVYNDEWTFRSHNREIRIDKNAVQKKQQAVLLEKMTAIRQGIS
ncbi:MAG TPA: hypothetical protein VL022_01490 [Moheibacter sp.]|nr:hypothetical protein [Moheibacter sp.]